MKTVSSFVKEVIAIIKGDDAEVTAQKIFRQADSAFKAQIAVYSPTAKSALQHLLLILRRSRIHGNVKTSSGRCSDLQHSLPPEAEQGGS